jgi:hypothetical protein
VRDHLYYRCAVCHRPPRGFCWLDPNREQPPERRRASFRRFCSRDCQDLYYQLQRKGVAMNRTDLEQKAAESVLGPLGDYVMQVGMDKGLGQYSKAEILGLVDTILEAYHRTLQELYKDEVPF